jgi:hypothetical protein
LAAGDERQSSAAPTIEPPGDVDIERRIYPGVAKKPNEELVAEIQIELPAKARQEKTGSDLGIIEADV